VSRQTGPAPRARATQQARRAQSAWSELPGAQKTIGVVVALALLVGAVAFVQLQRTPQLGPLFSGLSSADGGAVVEQLQAANVPYELTDGGATVLVPRDQVYDLRLQMSAAGLPGDDTGGYSLLDEQGVTASQFQQEVAYQRAMEGELAKTVGAIDGVDAAVVHLAVPKKDVFLDAADAPTASVLVQTATGRNLDKGQVQAIVNLVSSSVEGMTPEAVAVVDDDGTLLTGSGSAAGSVSGGGDAADATADFEQRVAGDLQNLLDTVVGPGNAVASVTAALDFDSAEATTERFLPPEDGVLPLSETVDTETYTGAGSGEAGVLGPDNILVPNGAGGESAYGKESRTVNNAVGKVTERVVSAPGDVQRLSVSVVVDRDAVARTDMLALQDTVSAAVGLDATRGDVVSVTQMPFDVGDAEAVAAELEAAQAAEADAGTQQLIWNAVLAGLVLLVVIITVVLGLRRRKQVDPVDLGLYEPMLQPEPEPAELPRVPAPRAVLPPAPAPEDEQFAALQQRRDEVIDLVDREPEEVAELLRSWLADRRSS